MESRAMPHRWAPCSLQQAPPMTLRTSPTRALCGRQVGVQFALLLAMKTLQAELAEPPPARVSYTRTNRARLRIESGWGADRPGTTPTGVSHGGAAPPGHPETSGRWLAPPCESRTARRRALLLPRCTRLRRSPSSPVSALPVTQPQP